MTTPRTFTLLVTIKDLPGCAPYTPEHLAAAVQCALEEGHGGYDPVAVARVDAFNGERLALHRPTDAIVVGIHADMCADR